MRTGTRRPPPPRTSVMTSIKSACSSSPICRMAPMNAALPSPFTASTRQPSTARSTLAASRCAHSSSVWHPPPPTAQRKPTGSGGRAAVADAQGPRPACASGTTTRPHLPPTPRTCTACARGGSAAQQPRRVIRVREQNARVVEQPRQVRGRHVVETAEIGLQRRVHLRGCDGERPALGRTAMNVITPISAGSRPARSPSREAAPVR